MSLLPEILLLIPSSQTSGEGFTPLPTLSPGSQHRGAKLNQGVHILPLCASSALRSDAPSRQAFWDGLGPDPGPILAPFRLHLGSQNGHAGLYFGAFNGHVTHMAIFQKSLKNLVFSMFLASWGT